MAGVDTITSGAGTDILIGGRFGDTTIAAGDGSNLVIGDSGRITASTIDDPEFGNQPITLGLVETTQSDDGGDDTITTGSGNDIVLGGQAADTIVVGEGDNIVLGDDGLIDYVRADRESVPGADTDPSDIDLIESTSTAANGGVDTITSGAGTDILIGGRFGDTTIAAGDGSNLVIGDSGRITASTIDDPEFGNQPITLGLVETTQSDDGGDDTITTGSGNDIVLGGQAADTIVVGEGDNIVLGDDGLIDYVRADRESVPGADTDPSDIDLIESTSTTANGGVDTITSGAGTEYSDRWSIWRYDDRCR